MFNKIKNKRVLGIGFIVFTIIVVVFIVYGNMEFKNEKQSVVKEKVKEEKKEPEKQTEKESQVSEPQEEHTNIAISASGVPKDVLELIDNKEAEMTEAIQIWANGYGYRLEEKAYFEGTVTMDYNRDEIAISFYFETEDKQKFDVVYYKKTGEFSIVPW